jgi:flagellar biosynthetic protein FlhB
MADVNDFERTEPASPRRLEQAREEGHVARSHELTTFAMLMAGAGGLWFLGAGIFQQMRALVHNALSLDAQSAFEPSQMMLRFQEQGIQALMAIAPMLGLLLIIAFCAPQILSGWLFSWNALRVDFERLGPIAGIQRVISLKGATELAKALVKATLLACVGAAVVWHYREDSQLLSQLPLEQGIVRMAQIVGQGFLIIAGALVLVAAADVPYQLWSYANELKMSRQEVRQEQKESEGDPQIKAIIRNQQRAMARRRMMAEVPTASVIVTNPTHYAVALKYEDKTMSAPRVVAKGADVMAAKIREIAQQHHVPILEAPALARSLYRHADLGDEVPESLYTAVAEVLAYVFQLRRYQSFGGRAPLPLPAITVPPELDIGGMRS